MPAEEHEAAGQHPFDRACQVDGLGNVGEVVEREADDVRPEPEHLPAQVRLAQHLKVHHTDLVAGLARRRGDAFQPQRFQPEEDLGVHEGTGMDEQQTHEFTSGRMV